MRKLSTLSLALLAVACSTKNQEMSLFHEDGRAKPAVAVASMIDTTTFDCAWSLSEEITSMIVNKIADSGKIFVQSSVDSPFAENPFGSDLAWMKREFQNQEFVVFLELVEHSTTPVLRGKKTQNTQSAQELASNLNMSVRIRVMDLRGATPKIVLQEMVRDSYYIPKSLIPTNYNEVVWGSPEYHITPMSIAHRQLTQEIVSRVSDYVLLAKSR
jgi:hypothetical protein